MTDDDLRVEQIAAQLEEAEQQRITDDWLERQEPPELASPTAALSPTRQGASFKEQTMTDKMVECPCCDGSGYDDESESCGGCDGTGQVTKEDCDALRAGYAAGYAALSEIEVFAAIFNKIN